MDTGGEEGLADTNATERSSTRKSEVSCS